MRIRSEGCQVNNKGACYLAVWHNLELLAKCFGVQKAAAMSKASSQAVVWTTKKTAARVCTLLGAERGGET